MLITIVLGNFIYKPSGYFNNGTDTNISIDTKISKKYLFLAFKIVILKTSIYSDVHASATPSFTLENPEKSGKVLKFFKYQLKGPEI